jgi:hypothetical protein
MHLQSFHIGQNSDEEEWLVSMGIVGVEGYVRPVSNCFPVADHTGFPVIEHILYRTQMNDTPP